MVRPSRHVPRYGNGSSAPPQPARENRSHPSGARLASWSGESPLKSHATTLIWASREVVGPTTTDHPIVLVNLAKLIMKSSES
jgi:hypothetical protein